VHAQLFACPALPQIVGGWHTPQLSWFPQPSSSVPQVALADSQVFGVQPQAFGTPAPPQVAGDVQAAQSMTSPHPSGTCPHSAPRALQVEGTQGKSPQRFAPSPPQYLPATHEPQSMTLVQPSRARPQFALISSHVLGLHVPPSVSGLGDCFRSSRSWVRLHEPAQSQSRAAASSGGRSIRAVNPTMAEG
jgi:hypothetical protein